MSHFARVLVLASFAASYLGCGGSPGGVAGNGKPISQTREVGTYRKVEVGGGIHVTFTKGPRSVVVTADDNLIDLVETSIRDESLVVRLKGFVNDTKGISVAVSNDVLEGLSLSGGSSFVGAPTAIPHFDLDASGGSTAELSDLASDSVSVSASGGSEVTLAGGAAKSLVLAVSGGSRVLSHGFVVEAASVDVSGGSIVCVTCTASLKGNVSGGSTVTLSGAPAIISVNSSGGSRLVKEN